MTGCCLYVVISERIAIGAVVNQVLTGSCRVLESTSVNPLKFDVLVFLRWRTSTSIPDV